MYFCVLIFLRMQPNKPQLQPHRPSLLLKMLPPPTRTLLLTSSWCRAARWGSKLTAGCHLLLHVFCLVSYVSSVNELLKQFFSYTYCVLFISCSCNVCIQVACLMLVYNFSILTVFKPVDIRVYRQWQTTSHSLYREYVAVRPNQRTSVHS